MTEQLRKILLRHFGNEEGEEIFRAAEKAYEQLLPLADGESQGRKKNLTEGIYPFAAIYSVLLEGGMTRETAMEHMFAIMKIRTLEGNRKFYHTLGKLPFFFPLFRKMFSAGLKGDSWTVQWVENNKNAFVYNIQTCLWHDACKDLGYPELCRIFCRNDELNFVDVSSHLYFQRTRTLGNGGDCCDFHFYPHAPKNGEF